MRRAAALRLMGGAATALLAGCGSSDCSIAVSPAVNLRPAVSRFGVQVYAPDDIERAVSLIAGCGGTMLRTGINGNYDFADAVLAAAARHSMRAILLTDFAPQPVNVDVYASTAAGMQKRYAQYAPVWEIWNEPNLAQYWGALPDVDVYATLAIETAKALRAAGASDVWSGGTSGLDFTWI